MKLFILSILIAVTWATPPVSNLKIQKLAKRATLLLLFLFLLYLS